MSNTLDTRSVLVTGGTGSMGKRFIERALTGEFGTPARLIVFSRDELKQHEMRLKHPSVEYVIGDMRSYSDITAALRRCDTVINAAALKQVPSCEYFPEQAVLTNIIGTQNLIRSIKEQNGHVSTVVTISTDKACKPTTAMGMTKAIQERLIVAANLNDSYTRYVGVRYGNVLESRGSVIPLFRDQIAAGGPVTVTDHRMTRFLLSLDDAVDTMMQAYNRAQPGEIVVPTAYSASVINIAYAMIGDRDLEVRVTGIRPNEKLHEAMVSEEEMGHAYQQSDYWYIQPTLPELVHGGKAQSLRGEYNSADNPLDLEDTINFLTANGIL